ncbi:MAG: L-seryl-tRNA(Sec) selenium transferase [Burkholderiales bacterium]
MNKRDFSTLPSVDRVLNLPSVQPLIERFGRSSVVDAVRAVLDEKRQQKDFTAPDEPEWEATCRTRLEADQQLSLRPVFNLTGTVLHTNLGRAPLSDEAKRAVESVLTQPSNLEYDLRSGKRGDRDDHIEPLILRLTGAQAATVVNNNAAAVFLVLNTLAHKKEVIVSRGELIEIGGAFRIPDIMARAGCKLVEVGTTNRTHLKDYEQAIGAKTALLLKVHTSNYTIQGFTASVDEKSLCALARNRELPLMVDLGSGTLVDLKQWGLPAEPTPQQALANGAQIITFSGDKLLGGPQAGIIVGEKALVARIKRNALKRALRVDKITLAMLEATLKLYLNPEKLVERLPTLRLLTRPAAEIEALCARVKQWLEGVLDDAIIEIQPCKSQIGSGSLPIDLLPSFGLAIRAKRHSGKWLEELASSFRALPIPVIGRVENDALLFDLRCLEDEAAFIRQLNQLSS